MGYVRHNAMVITSSDSRAIETVETEAKLIGLTVVGPGESELNGYRTILIAPDGSKEGWTDSDDGDTRRDQLRKFMSSMRYSDGSSPLEWFEAQYGSDDRGAEICASEWS